MAQVVSFLLRGDALLAARKGIVESTYDKKHGPWWLRRLLLFFLHPRKRRTRAPVLTGGPGAALGGGFEEWGGAHARKEGGHFL